ncbi:hypothetical protein HPP92_013677 [Vanilla planifolia]|uniref:Endonuclease/exonuclease/phosphatase domain-containing protein n=1 Tax=Vanilla planifolia TaxID=51239 RepID=A0A835QTI7_VANPL|nr:hypothetical protein HPP92_013677 [Vanilla planifolia]
MPRGRRIDSHGFATTVVKVLNVSSSMLRTAGHRLRRLRWPLRGRRKVTGKTHVFTCLKFKANDNTAAAGNESLISPEGDFSHGSVANLSPPIRIATFNGAMFAMAPAVQVPQQFSSPARGDTPEDDIRCKSANDRPRSILKQPSMSKPKLRVSINLPDNEIESRSRRWSSADEDGKGKSPFAKINGRSVLDVLKEVGADIIGLQNVKAEEEKGMRPLADLAAGLGMKFVFAESWAPEYGNAVLSRFPIKQWRTQKICDDTDFRNVMKVTIEVPSAGELNFHCTHLDHLDENWRMKQIKAILRSNDEPHILAGGLNALDETDYSVERWASIVKYHEEIGKPSPKSEVMKFLKTKKYVDAKNFAGECEAVVVLAKGQDVQGTCKYGTRVDYILSSPNSPYKFVPGSYEVLSSKGTSDHHVVKVDVMVDCSVAGKQRKDPWRKQRQLRGERASFKRLSRTNSS